MTALEELGLSEYEETVYRSLSVTGAATASAVSDASGVPRGRIYDVLDRLRERGLVATRATDPREYTAVDPSTAVDRLLAARGRDLREEWDRYVDAAASVRAELLPTPPADGSVWLGSLGGGEMQTALRRHVGTASDTVLAAVGPPYESASWERLQTELDAFFDGVDDGVAVSVLVSDATLEGLPSDLPNRLASRAGTVRLRAHPTVPVSFDVIDGRVTTVDVPRPTAPDDRVAVLAVHASDVVATFERQFRRLWADATPLLE